MQSVVFVLLSAALAQPVPQDEELTPAQRRPLEQQAQALVTRAEQLYLQGRLADALPAAEQALAIRRRLFPAGRYPAGHADLADSLNRLGFLYRAAGQPAKAERFLADALRMRRQLYPPEKYPDGHPDLGISLNNLAYVLQARGDLARAEQGFRQALAMAQKLYPAEKYPDGHPEIASGLNSLGFVLQARGELAAAEPCYRAALAMWRRLWPPEQFPDGHHKLSIALGNLGTVVQARGDLAGAESYYDEALAMDRKLYPPERFPRGHPDLGMSLNNKGFLLASRGEHARAEPYYRQALAMNEKLYAAERFPAGHPDLARSLNNLGFVLQRRGELAQAEQYLRAALAMRQRLYPPERFPKGHRELALSLNNVGNVLQQRGQDGPAEAVYRQALRMYEQLFPPERFPKGHPDVFHSLNNLGNLLRQRGELTAAEPPLRAALAMCRQLYPDAHPDRARALNNLAFVLQDRGAYDQAEPLLREALALYEKVYPPARFPQGHPEQATCLQNLGVLLRDCGRFAEAEVPHRRALVLLEQQLYALLGGSSEAQALNHLAQLPLTRDGYLSTTRPLADRDAAAYEVVWQSRGALARWLSQRRLAALAAADPRGRDLARQLAEKRRLLAALLLAGGALNADQAKRVRLLSEEKERLEKELAATLPAFAQALETARSSPRELLQHLPEGTAYVDLLRYVHFSHDPQKPGRAGERQTRSYVAFVLAAGGAARRVELGPAAPIDQAVAEIRNPKIEIQNSKAAAELRRRVWEPLARHLPAGTRTIYLAPDGALTQLPWAALPGERPDTVLLEDYTLAVLPHGQFLLEHLQSSGGRKLPAVRSDHGTVLAVGEVAYGPATGKLSWPALPGTRRELEGLAALAGKRAVQARRGPAATTAQVLHDLPEARWAHLATHGYFADQAVRSVLHLSEEDYQRGRHGERVGVGARSPLVLSGLVLAGANVSAKDPEKEDGGILTAEAIAGLNLDGLELAVLSACETGLGEVAGGEGVFGLQRAFHIAGAQNVVASLWQVDDEATAALMGLFYHQLWAEKRPPLEALRQAQLALYRHPERIGELARARGPDFEKAARLPAAPQVAARAPARLWAGFVLSGAGR
jgi:CHAT domain-containing protein/Tfp pilus assembly protein PilF